MMRAIVMMALLHGVASPSPEVAMTHARPTMVLATLLATACEQPLAPPLDALAPGRVMLSIVADTLTTPFGDAHIRHDLPNRQLEAPGLSVRTTLESIWRVLVSWKQDSIAAVVGTNAVDSAFLEFEVIDVTGEAGGYVGLHRATQEWGEDEVTWNCANDPINNDELDCDAADLWDMTDPAQWPFVSAPTDSAFVTESTSGFVRFDVTSDVQAFVSGSAQNYGWVLKRTDESQPGFVWLYDKDSPPPPAGPGAPPKLILHTAVQDTTRPAVPDTTGIPENAAVIKAVSTSESEFFREYVGIRFSDTTSGVTVNAVLAQFQATIVGGHPRRNVYLVKIPDPGSFAGLDSIRAAMKSAAGVDMAMLLNRNGNFDPRSRYPTDGVGGVRADWFDNVTSSGVASRLAIRAPLAWGCETGEYGGVRPRLGVLDLIGDGHSDLPTVVVDQPSTSLQPSSLLTNPTFRSHGVAVAGIMAAMGDNGQGIAGMIWDAEVFMLSFGRDTLLTTDLLGRLDSLVTRAVSDSVRVMVSSTGFGDESVEEEVGEIRLAVERYLAASPSNLWVMALPDVGGEIPLATAATDSIQVESASDMALAQIHEETTFADQIIFVVGTDAQAERWTPSMVWTNTPSVGGAPATNILTLARPADQSSGVWSRTGVSYAAPFVAGLAAMLHSMDSSLTAAEVKDYILRGARDSVMDPSTGVKTAKQPLAGLPDVYQLDAYAPLRLLSAERMGSPICGYEVRLEDNEIVFEKPTGQIVTPFPGQSENTSRGGISVAQGGRLMAGSANFTGQPGGEGVLVLNQTAGVVAQIPGPFYRQYLERDTVDVFVSPTADSSFPDPGRLVITRGRTGAVQDFDLLAITSPDPQTQGTRIARIDVAPSGQYAAIQGLYFGTLPDAGPRVYIVPLVPGAPAIQVGNRDRTPSAPCQNSLTGALGPLWSHDSRRLSTAFSTQTRNAPQTLPMWINTCTVWSTFNLLSDSGSVVFAADTGSVTFQGTAIFAHRLTGDDRFMITTEMNVGGFNNSPIGPCDIVLRNALTPALFSLTLRPGAPDECNATLKTVPVISNTVALEGGESPAKPSDREF